MLVNGQSAPGKCLAERVECIYDLKERGNRDRDTQGFENILILLHHHDRRDNGFEWNREQINGYIKNMRLC